MTTTPTMTTRFDGRYEYEGWWNSRAHCRLRVFEHPDRPAVVIATEQRDNQGTSVTNMVEHLMPRVARDFGLDPDTLLWVEHYGAGGGLPERFALVELRDGKPAWVATHKARIEALIGRPLDD